MEKARSGQHFVRLVGSLLFIAAMTSSSSSPAQRAKIIDRLPVEVVANIVWQGRELEMRKVISCDQRRRMHPGTEGDRELRPREVWDQSVYRIGHVLPSGEVLIIELPGVCRQFDKRIYPPPQGFLPVTLLLDQAESPQAAEEIVSYRYFEENSRRRFQFAQFRIERSNRGIEAIDDDQRLTWLLGSSGKPDAYFVSVSAAAIPKSEWARYPVLAATLQGRSTGLVQRSLVEQNARILLLECEGGANGIGPAERCLTSEFDDRPFIVSGSPISGDSWRLDLTDPGLRRYKRLVDASRLDSSGCKPSFPACNLLKGNYQLVVDSRSFPLSKVRGDLIFDAERQLLLRPSYRIRSSTLVNPNRVGQ